MLDLHIPELTFRNVTYGRHETPWDLRALLYRGGAGAKANKVSKFIEEGRLGGPIAVRLSLLVKFHDYLLGNLASGGSRATAQGQIYQLRMLYQHADRTQADPTEENLKAVYVDWIAHLQQQQRLKKIKHLTAYKAGAIAGTLVADALGIPATILRHAARLYKPKASRRVLSVKADKQNLAQTTTFGHALLDLTESLSLAAMRGPLPISIRFRTGHRSSAVREPFSRF